MPRRSFRSREEREDPQGLGPDVDGDLRDEQEYGREDASSVGDGNFYDLSSLPPGHWAHRLRKNPKKAEVPYEPVGPDEVRWGDQRPVNIDATAGTGIFVQDVLQFVQVKRPARAWMLDLAFSLPGISALPTLPNFEVTVTFTVILGLGSSRITRYEQLFSADLVAFPPDPSFPARLNTPIVSEVISNLPADDIIVDAHVEYQRILLAGPSTIQVMVAAGVAPVFR